MLRYMSKGLPGCIHYYLINPNHPLKGRKKQSIIVLLSQCSMGICLSPLCELLFNRYFSSLVVQAKAQLLRQELWSFKSHLETRLAWNTSKTLCQKEG